MTSSITRRRVGPAGSLLLPAVIAVALLAGGCTSAPEMGTPPPAAPGPAQESGAGNPATADEGQLSAAAHHDEALYNLASGDLARGGSSLEAEWESHAAKLGTSGPAASPGRIAETPLARVQESDLIAELNARWTRTWTELSGGLGTTPSLAELDRREQMAGKLVALAFVRADHGAADPAVAQALAFLGQDESRRDLKLLAAAMHEHLGEDEAVTRLLGGLGYCPGTAASSAAPGEPQTAPFEVVGLTFAAAIEGPGKFVPLDPEEVAPGKSVLIYGEFRNFTSVRESSGAASSPFYRRAFQASLRLVTMSDAEVDRLEFLPEKRGRQTASTLAEVMNFWARYRLPGDLKPGKYKLVVDAQDLLGSAVAMAELPLEIRSH